MTDYDDTDNKIYGKRYAIRSKIARGGMADVYLAHDQLLDRPVALKVLFPELSVDPTFVERFRREAQNAARLSHPNIVSVYDWGEEGSTYFIVMEYIDGRSLSVILREDGALRPDRAAHIGADVAAALDFAHKNGVIHRDVKPGNVLIDRSGLVKVTDFGIARARNTTENLTQTGAVMGTATYFSPEQAQGNVVDQRSDVYSLGVVLYELVAGKPPFVGDNPVTIAYKHVREEPVPLRQINSAIPQTYASIVSKAMSKSPGARYASADELRADLKRFENGAPISAAAARGIPDATTAMAAVHPAPIPGGTGAITAVAVDRTPHESTRPPKDRSLWGPVLLFISLIAIVAIGLIILLNSGGTGGNATLTIPSVVGKAKADAEAQLKALKLQVTETDQTDNSAAGTVLSQNPAGNTQGHQNDVVQLTISSGAAPITLQDFTGQSGDAAKTALQEAGLQVTVQQQTSSTVASGNVISQNPAGGTQVPSGSSVTLIVSSGPQSITVPDVVGFTVATASQTLSSAGLRTSYPAGTDPTTLVESTNPAAGEQVALNSTVVLTPQVATTTTPSSFPFGDTTSSSTTSTTKKPRF